MGALFSNTLGTGNTGIGYNALLGNTIGTGNSALGTGALYTNTSGIYNTALGYGASYTNDTGYNNTAIGYQSLYNSSSGNAITAVGVGSLISNTTGASSTAIGYTAGFYNQTGNYNTLLGFMAEYFSNSNNTFIGTKSGYAITTGSNNIMLGYQAGDTLTNGSNNIIIGYDIDATSTIASKQLNIGNLLFGTLLDGTGTTLSSGNIGVGSNTPNAKFSVQADASTDELLRVANSSSQNLFQVSSLGYTGIGACSSPAYRLHVASSDANYLGYFYNSSTATSAGGLYVRSDGDGNLLTLNANGTDVLTVSPSQASFNVPVSFQSAGDVSMAYDLYFTNDTAGYIKYLSPGYITTESPDQNYDLTLSAANDGYVIVDDTFIVTGNTGIGTDTPGAMLSIQSPTATDTPILNIASSTGSTLMFMGANGYLGVGTSAPNNLIEVKDLIVFKDADWKTQLGYQAGLYNLGQYNSFIGYQAGYGSSTASTNAADSNTAVGYQSLYSNSTGLGNTVIGRSALRFNTSGT